MRPLPNSRSGVSLPASRITAELELQGRTPFQGFVGDGSRMGSSARRASTAMVRRSIKAWASRSYSASESACERSPLAMASVMFRIRASVLDKRSLLHGEVLLHRKEAGSRRLTDALALDTSRRADQTQASCLPEHPRSALSLVGLRWRQTCSPRDCQPIDQTQHE
jgi:hypothetical protein